MARKKLFLCLIFLILAAMSAASLFGCTNVTEEAVSIESMVILTSHEGPYILNADGHIDDMNLSKITVKVTYSNGEEAIIKVNDTMFSLEDINKFETKGDHTLFIKYGNASVPLTISVRSYNEVNVYTAVFMSQGGTQVENQYTNKIVRFPEPSRENYEFDGWYTNFECTGDHVVAGENGYALTADIIFYAKWKDKRRCNVTFYDLDEVLYQFEVVYGTSINPDDEISYPHPSEKEGKIFTGWQVTQGQFYEINTDLVLRAKYEALKCVITLDGDQEGYEGNYSNYVDYGSKVIINEIPPQIAGHEARWVVYVNDNETFIELDDDSINYEEGTKTLTVDKTKMVIKAYQEINTYEIKVYNGLATQSQANIKAGNILLEQIYTTSGAIFKKEYNTNFNLAIIDGKNDVIATAYEGYNIDWCFITYDETNKEIWRKADNLIWSDELGRFRLNTENGDIQTRNYELKDASGKTLCRIKDGNITEIQGDLLIKPKYTKKNYTITLVRNNKVIPIDIYKTPENPKYTYFTVPYLTDFALYNPSVKEYEGTLTSWQNVKDFYLKNTVASWLTADMSKDEVWQTAKWDIAWYTHSSSTANEYKVDFAYNEQLSAYGSYEIKENTVLYARDIDNRTYDITIRYGYDFATNTYTKEKSYTDFKQNQALELPSDLTNSVTYNGVVYSYTALYDYPYKGVSTKNFASPITNHDSRAKNMVYYAHYANKAKYELRVFDKTQSEAYTDPNSSYIVANGSIYHSVSSGEILNISMLYKGTPAITSQTYYNNKVFYENFNSVTTNAYIQLLNGRDKATAITEITKLMTDKQAIVDNYIKLLNVLSSYTYGNIDLEGYASYEEYYNKYLTDNPDCYDFIKIYGEYIGTSYKYTSNAYDTYREEIYDYQQQLNLINNYDANQIKASNFEHNWSYYPYSNSVNNLNEINPGVTDYYFAGWYYDSAYTQKADDIATDPENPLYFSVKMSKDIVLYAKWVDKKKGSEGLIFERVASGQVVVVAYLNEAQCGTNYNNAVYSRNLNDQGKMPKELGTKVSIQIPSEHKFVLPGGTIEICTVVGIVAGAFDTNATIINDIALPNSIRFIEEGLFKYCNITVISYQTGETNYLYVDADIALYQNLDYPNLDGTILNNGKVLSSCSKGTLLAYANKSIVNTIYTIPDEINGTPVKYIADYAFRSTAKLEEIILGNNVIEIGDYTFMGCNKLQSVDLPNSLVTIGANAFRDCSLLAVFNFISSPLHPVSELKTIKQDAFTNTAWLVNSNGIIILNSLLIGIQFRGDGAGYEKDGLGNKLISEYNEYYIIGRDELNNTLYTVYVSVTLGTITRIVINTPITAITDYAFSGMNSLISLDINAESLTSIDSYAFNSCSGLSVIYFRGAAMAINLGAEILAGCSRNISFVFPKDYITVDNMLTGERWASLVASIDMMEIDEGVQSILTYYRKASGTTVTIPSFVTEIQDSVFSTGFSNIAQVIIPNTVVKIGQNSFANMTNLTSLTIPVSVTEIGRGAFYNCTNIIQLKLPFIGETSTTNSFLGYIFGTVDTTNQNQVSYVPASLTTLILTNNPNYTAIADYALYELDIANITLTESIVSIGKHAFDGNTKLKSIFFNEFITIADDYAFRGCIELTAITFHTYNSLTFGDYSFYGCTKLASLNLNNYAQTIGDFAFANCTLLRSVYIKALLQEIGVSAFEGCTTLGTVSFPAEGALKVIGASAFKNCPSILSLSLNIEVESIGLGAFEGCTNLDNITLTFVGAKLDGTGATHFGYIFGAASYADNNTKVPAKLKTVTIRANATWQAINIADYAFGNLTNLTTVNLSAATIGTEGALAFNGCTAAVIR